MLIALGLLGAALTACTQSEAPSNANPGWRSRAGGRPGSRRDADARDSRGRLHLHTATDLAARGDAIPGRRSRTGSDSPTRHGDARACPDAPAGAHSDASSCAHDDADPLPAPTARPAATTAPTPTTRPTPTATPLPTATPAPTVEPCREPYESLIVSGPSGPAPPQDGDRVFRSLTVHPLDADIVFLGTERNGFMRSLDGGLTWTRHRQGLWGGPTGYDEVWDIDISPTDPSVMMAGVVGSPGPPTGPDTAAGLYKSTDGGDTWVQLNCGFTTSRVVSIRIDPTDPDVAVAGLEGGVPSYTGGENEYWGGGIFRTEDGGTNWQRVDIGPDDDRNGFLILRLLQTDPPTLMTFAIGNELSQSIGFIRSTDMGRTWELFADEFRNREINNFAVSSDGQVIYADEGDTYSGWISRDGGDTWTQSAIIQVNGPLAVSPADPNLVIFASSDDLRRSTNGLATFQVVLNPAATIREIVFAPSAPNVVYAETDGYLLYRSDDTGLTWRLLVNGRDEVLNAQP